MPVVPRWLAIVWIVAGIVGVVGSLAVATVGTRFVNESAASGLEIVEVTRGLLGTASDTADVIDDIIGDAAAGLVTVEDSVATGAATLDRISVLADDLGGVVTSDIPQSLEELSDAMPQVIATAGVIDGVMRTLSFVGVDYDPDAPLDDALRELDIRLAAIPAELREQAAGFDEAADGVAEFAGSSVEIASEIGSIRKTLLDSQQVLAEYEASIDEGHQILDDLEVRLTDQVGVAETALLLLGIALAVGQTVPIAFGYWALRAVSQAASIE